MLPLLAIAFSGTIDLPGVVAIRVPLATRAFRNDILATDSAGAPRDFAVGEVLFYFR
jgi:hypothetical protein